MAPISVSPTVSVKVTSLSFCTSSFSPSIVCFYFSYGNPSLISYIPCMPGAECCAVCHSYAPLSSIQLKSPAQPSRSDRLRFLRTPSAESIMFALAVQALFLRGAERYAGAWWVLEYGAHVLCRSVQSGAVAALRSMVATLALYVAPSSGEKAKAVETCLCG